MARFFAMRCTPRDSTMVTMAGNPSGMAATARLTPVKNISPGAMPFHKDSKKINPQMTKVRFPNKADSPASFFCRGVCSSFWSSIAAILPMAVLSTG